MKEITAVIRRDKVEETKIALEALNHPSLSIISVDGRGRQRGLTGANAEDNLMNDMAPSVKLKPTPSVYALVHTIPKAVTYIPKKMLVMVVPDNAVDGIVSELIRVNRTGVIGDGKIFVSSIESSIQIRTGDREN